MLRLIDPKELHPLTLPFDDGPNKTIFWARPMTEREFSLMRAKGMPTGDDAAQDAEGWAQIAKLIGKIENVNWMGRQCASFDDHDTILAILNALPVVSGKALARRIADFCLLAGDHSKNLDGSSALLDTGSPIAMQASTKPNGASEAGGQSTSESPESGTGHSSESQQ